MVKSDKELAVQVGKRIKNIIGDHSYVEIARSLGVKPNTVWSYVNGVILPSQAILIKIAETFNVSLDWLLRGKEPEARPAVPAVCDLTVLKETIAVVEELARAEGLDIEPAKKAEIVTIIYEEAVKEGAKVEEIKPLTARLLRLAT